MEIKRDFYLQKLIDRENNGLIKIVTGIRRSGKSYLLNTLFHKYLNEKGVDDAHIIKVALDSEESEPLLESMDLTNYIKGRIKDDKTYYLFFNKKSEKIGYLNDNSNNDYALKILDNILG